MEPDREQSSSIIEVDNLQKRFGTLTAVAGLSFSVAEGEIFGFLGPNGAGKSTTIGMLCTLLRPSAGTARVGGHDIVHAADAVRRSIGLVFQDPSVDINLTARENVEFHGVIYGVPRGERQRRAEELLRMVDLWERRNDVVRTFSGGMKRRLEIARGLLHHPRVLFLDEPTIGLDPQTREAIWEHIRELRRTRNISIFLTTHYMDEAENCDRIAIIDHGQLVALDTPDGLKRMVGGDVISVRSDDPEAAEQEIQARFGLPVQRTDGTLRFEVERGDEFIPEFVRGFRSRLLSISLNRPTLDDVFIKLTGHAIREEEASATDVMRTRIKAFSRSGR